MIFNAILSNKAHPEYGAATISFPIPNDQYDSSIDLLHGIGIGDATAQDCRVDEVPIGMPVLNRLVTQSVNVDELDYLAKRLTSFCKSENVQFQELDGQSIALDLIQSGAGVVTPYGVVYDNGMVLDQTYNGHQFPAYLYDSHLMMLEISPKSGLQEGQNPEYLYFPAAEQQIERSLLRVSICSLYDAQVRLDFDELPEKVAEALDLEDLSGSDLPDLNRMCQAIQALSDADIGKLDAVVLMAEAGDTISVCQLAENLDQFDFVPGIQTAEEYGRYVIQKSGHFEYDENLEGFYNYRLYGEQHIQQEGGQFTECGYVAYHSTMTLDELMREDPAEQYQREQGMGA